MPAIATCNCGGTVIEVPELPAQATSCNCTYCTKSGGLWASYDPAVPKIIKDEHRREFSQSGFNLHYFCGNCGCATYNINPDWSLLSGDSIPEQKKFSLNVRLLDDIDMKVLRINEIDGRNLW